MNIAVLARKPLEGTVAENVLRWGTGGLNIDGCRVDVGTESLNGGAYAKSSVGRHDGVENWRYKAGCAGEFIQPDGRWPANTLISPDPEILRGFPNTTSGKVKEDKGGYKSEGNTVFLQGRSTSQNQHGDSGSAARFFSQFEYTEEDIMFFDDEETPVENPKEIKLNGYLYAGDNLEYLRTLPDNSVDSVVTDPPYGLGKEPDPRKVLAAWLNDEVYQPGGKGFMGKEWDSFVPSPVIWQECLRVLKPGGHMIAFAGTRTYDWIVLGVRLAGFEIRDTISWLYGCLTPETKALTPDGPRDYRELSVGDLVVCWDPETQTYSSQGIEEIFEYDHEGELRGWEVNGELFRYTLNHRLLMADGGFVEAGSVASEYPCRVYSGESVVAKGGVRDRYQGKVWCLKVPTGSFVISQGGVEIPTGNSGFPKSLNVEKSIRNKYAIETDSGVVNDSSIPDILELWKTYLNLAGNASKLSLKETIEVGISTQNNSFAVENAAQISNPKKSKSLAKIAVPLSQDPLPTYESTPTVQENVGEKQPVSKNPAMCAELWCENQCLSRITMDFSAAISAWESQRGKIKDKHKAEEALKIWLGNQKSSNKEATNALCAALTENLRLIILSQSEASQNADMMSQMDYVSATHVITTEFMAECLISYMVDTLRKNHLQNQTGDSTPEAQQWEGWGTALKPSCEPAVLARKPLEGTVAENVLKHGTGALNIDGCRIEADWDNDPSKRGFGQGFSNNETRQKHVDNGTSYKGLGEQTTGQPVQGRWPANTVTDGSESVVSEFPETSSGKPVGNKNATQGYEGNWGSGIPVTGFGDTGSAARFFTQAPFEETDATLFKYCAKASTSERNEGTEALQAVMEGKGNIHSTVKPVTLIEWMVKLVTPPGGTVLDPFIGSGTTGVAAELAGFRWIGCERETDYAMIAYHRIAYAVENREAILAKREKPAKPAKVKSTAPVESPVEIPIESNGDCGDCGDCGDDGVFF